MKELLQGSKRVRASSLLKIKIVRLAWVFRGVPF